MIIVGKSGWVWGVLHWIVMLVTLGQQRRFRWDYATTIGPYVALPEAWLVRTEEPWLRWLLVHEAVHIEQQRRLGLGSVWLGLLPWGLLWLCGPLPVVLAWGRWYLEREAYLAGWRATLAELAPEERAARRAVLIDHGVRQLTTAAYGWAWPWPMAVRAWWEDRL
jgi:hypothetical protein